MCNSYVAFAAASCWRRGRARQRCHPAASVAEGRSRPSAPRAWPLLHAPGSARHRSGGVMPGFLPPSPGRGLAAAHRRGCGGSARCSSKGLVRRRPKATVVGWGLWPQTGTGFETDAQGWTQFRDPIFWPPQNEHPARDIRQTKIGRNIGSQIGSQIGCKIGFAKA